MSYKKTFNSSSEASKKIALENNSKLGLVLNTGEAVCGKSALISHFFTRHHQAKAFVYSVGTFPGSQIPIIFLKCLCASLD